MFLPKFKSNFRHCGLSVTLGFGKYRLRGIELVFACLDWQDQGQT